MSNQPNILYVFTDQHECGVNTNAQGIHEHPRSQELGVLMSSAGYECAYTGKWHVPGSLISPDHGFTRLKKNGDNQIPAAYDEYFRQKHDKPFFLVASFREPHSICQWGRSQIMSARPIASPPTDVSKCPGFPPNFAIPAYESEMIRVEQSVQWFIYSVFRSTEDDWRRHRWTYYRLIEKVDAWIGQILDSLKRHGLNKNTIGIFSSDPWRKDLVVETIFEQKMGQGWGTAGRALHTGQYKYIVYDVGKNREQLIDLVNDPGEMGNLAVEAKHRNLLNDIGGGSQPVSKIPRIHSRCRHISRHGSLRRFERAINRNERV